MKLLGQIISIHPLALLVSLPNQLYAHVPITNVSSQYTNALERLDEEHGDDQSDDEKSTGGIGSDNDDESLANVQSPELSDMFRVGQFVRAVVTAVHAPGASNIPGLEKSRDQLVKASKRVELSLSPEKVNAGVPMSDLRTGFAREHFFTCIGSILTLFFDRR
jgi:rRNA biogenesis protein RRP5